MIKILTILLLLANLVSCASASRKSDNFDKAENSEEVLNRAEANASVGGKKILESSRSMISDHDMIVGGCWDYINAVYNRSGYPAGQRVTVYKSKQHGPYANVESIEAGDWLYFINHSFGDIEHSAVFVAWINEEKKDALMISYVGGNQKKPATYKRFILNNVYNIIRTLD